MIHHALNSSVRSAAWCLANHVSADQFTELSASLVLRCAYALRGWLAARTPKKRVLTNSLALNPAQQHVLNRLSDEVRETCERVANEERKPLKEGAFTHNPTITGVSPIVNILYSGVRVVIFVNL